MKLTLDIDDSIAFLLGGGGEALENRVKIDLAVHYYEHGDLSPGRAAELAGMSRPDFERLLKARKIVRPYTEADLRQELKAKF